MRFCEIILEDYKTAARKFIEGGSNEIEVKNFLKRFKQIVPKIKDNNEKNIDWWAKNRNFYQFMEYIRNIESMPSAKQLKKGKTGRSHNLIENGDWLVVVPLDKDASCFHGRTTDWCTTKPFQNNYENYFYDREITLIYFIKKKTGEKWAIAAHKDNLKESEFFDKNDNPLSQWNFEQQTKFKVNVIFKKAFGEETQSKVSGAREDYNKAIIRIKELLDTVPDGKGIHNLELEKLLIYTKSKRYIQDYFETVYRSEKYNKNLQNIAVNLDGTLIKFIINPEERIQKAAVRSRAISIRFIKNPSESVKQEAVSEDGSVIKYIVDPSKEIQLQAVKENPYLYLNSNGIENKEDEDIQKAAVQFGMYSDDNLKYILENDILASDDVISYAIQANNRYNQHNLFKIVTVLMNHDDKELLERFKKEIQEALMKDTSGDE